MAEQLTGTAAAGCLFQGLGEIAFCAVAASKQVRGFGTRLMNHTKAMARDKDGLTHFLTYADNNAVGYFTKQVQRAGCCGECRCCSASPLMPRCPDEILAISCVALCAALY